MNVDQERLARENRYVLDAVQALLGLIGPTVEAVALQVVDGDVPEVVLRFWTHGNEAQVAEDADDAIADLEGLIDPEDARNIRVEILPGSPPRDAFRWAGRMLYWAKTPPKPGDADEGGARA